MVRNLIFVSCLLVGALCQRMGDAEPEQEPEILCRRELCATICPFGYTTDARGCPTCDCLVNPCMSAAACGYMQRCSIRHTCEEHPCTHGHVEAVCTDIDMPCAEPLCASPCRFGLKRNERGCLTCECLDAPADPCQDATCPLDHACVAVPQPTPEDLLERMPPGSYRRGQHLCLPTHHVNPFLNRFGDMPQLPPVEPDTGDEGSEISLFFQHNIVGDVREHLEALTREFERQLGHLLGNTEINLMTVVVKEIAVDGTVAEQRVRVVLTVRTDQPLLSQLIERAMQLLSRGDLTIVYGEYTLRQVPEPVPQPVIPEEGQMSSSSEEEGHHGGHRGSSSSESGSDSDESGCGRIWREHRGLSIVAIAGAVLITGVVVALACITCLKRRMAQRSLFNHKKMTQYQENLTYGNDMLTSQHPDVIISEKGGRANAYMVSVPETEEKY